MKITDERLEKNYNTALNIVYNVIGKNEVKKLMRKVVEVKISPRAVRRHGVCRYENGNCIIEVSKHLFRVDDKEMINTLIHEILHTFKDTKGHNYKWKWYAKKISDNTEYKIERTGTSEALTIDDYNYLITCVKCGNKIKRHRISQRFINSCSKKSCYCTKCHGQDFKIIDLKDNRIIL